MWQSISYTICWFSCSDQLCSLAFTLSNLYFVACVYESRFRDPWVTCSSSINWGIPFALSCLPLVMRAVQSVKRYVDDHHMRNLANVSCIVQSSVHSILTAKLSRQENTHPAYFITFSTTDGDIMVCVLRTLMQDYLWLAGHRYGARLHPCFLRLGWYPV